MIMINWFQSLSLIKSAIDWALPTQTLNDTFRMIEQDLLDVPQGFSESDELYLFYCCNGCGSATAKFDYVPDSIFGLCITAACHLHDFEYEHAYTLGEKLTADERFRVNIHKIVDADRSWWRSKAKMKNKFEFYFTMVRKAGVEALEKKRYLHNQLAFNRVQGMPTDFNIDSKTLDWEEIKDYL